MPKQPLNSLIQSSPSLYRLKPLIHGVRVVMAGGMLVGMVSPSYAQLPLPAGIPADLLQGGHALPVPGVTDNLAPNGKAMPWLGAGSADKETSADGHTMTITQHSNRAILNWQSFNVGKHETVDFKQETGNSAIALNRIFDQNPTYILGHISATGQIYLVNNNGFIFANGAVVDANTLVASALNISADAFKSGLANYFNDSNGGAALGGVSADTNDAQNEQTKVNPDAKILIEHGSTIHVNDKGQIILAAPKVDNSGNLYADKNGQIMLVASHDKVYLQPTSSTSPFAGMLVEVGRGGTVNNLADGNIAVRQGNVTLAGFAVNQSGRISATTSVNVNGSIRLLAREGGYDARMNSGNTISNNLAANSSVRDNANNPEGVQNAQVTIGKDSSMEVKPDVDGGTAIDSLAQTPSYVEVAANKIDMQAGSAIVAPNATVDFKALDNGNLTSTSGLVADNTSRINLEDGAVIDVSGVKNIKVDMERNVAEVSVQSFNLRDAPEQRNGVLMGETVKVDVRNLPNIIDASNATTGIKRGVDERSTQGGTVNLQSSGDVVVNSGAKVDISGGSLAYQDGYIKTSKLVDSLGGVVDISKADPNQHYVGIYGTVTENHTKWGVKDIWKESQGQFEKGYIEGKAAGALNITSPRLAWGGELKAGAVSGFRQRGNPVFGGSFSFNKIDADPSVGLLFSKQNLIIQNAAADIKVGMDDKTLADNSDLVLSSEMLSRSGISDLKIAVNGQISLAKDAALNLPVQSKLTLRGSTINVDGMAHSSGGNFDLNSFLSSSSGGSINLASGSRLDVSGNWVNDLLGSTVATPYKPESINAGTIKLTADKDLNFNQGAAIKADGGAWLNASGSRVTAGNAGSISLLADSSKQNGMLHLNGDLSVYGLSKGGSLKLVSNKINIGASPNESGALNLGITNGSFDFAAKMGFSAISMSSNNGGVTVKSDTDLNLIGQNRLLNADAAQHKSGDSIAGFSQVVTLPENLRNPLSLTLGNVTMETGSAIRMDKQSTVNFTGSSAYIDGLIEAKGGSIGVNISGNTIYDPLQSIWLGEHANLDVSGATRLNLTDLLGRTSGAVLDGGTVSLNASHGYVVVQEGAQINASGISARLDLPAGNGLQYQSKTIGSDAGQIKITAAEGVVLDGSLNARAGSTTNQGGSLSLKLDRNGRGTDNIDKTFPYGDLRINVVQDFQKSLPSGMQFGSALSSNLVGQATISSQQLAKSGITDLNLAVPFQRYTNDFFPNKGGEIRFLGNVDLNTASSISLDASIISAEGLQGGAAGTIKLNTGLLQLGTSSESMVQGMPVRGDGSLIANADLIQLNGANLLTGFKQIELNSQHDLRALGYMYDKQTAFTGQLKTAANLTLRAGQIDPGTLTNYRFDVVGIGGQITLASSGAKDATPLSAAGKLSFNADVINQNGVLKAPLGTIELNAASKLTFGAGSMTSVSADGKVIPFGVIANNLWEYPLVGSITNGKNLVFNAAPDNLIVGEKHLVFTAPDVQFNKGSVVDVSGGGNLLAAEFQPGFGGSYDYLDPASKSYQGGFAILPSLGNATAPYDPYLSANFNYDSRTTVHLSGIDKLPTGDYTILPARYALLPGAYLITPQAKTQDQTTVAYTTSGLPVVSGYLAMAGSNVRDSRSSGYLVETSDQVKKHSFYDIHTADEFFASTADKNHVAVPLRPMDSGQISIDASTRLIMEGLFKVDAPSGGRGAQMDISANNIKVVKAQSATSTPGTLELLDKQLSGLNVDSLLLGGKRVFDNATGNTDLSVTAENVTFDQGASMQVRDLLATARDTVSVGQNASISAKGVVNTGVSQLNVSGDNALLRVSADKQLTVNRSDTTGSKGTLLIDASSTLSAEKSMLLDASRATQLDGTIDLKGGALTLAAGKINIGETPANASDALNLTSNQLQKLTVDDLLLQSRSAINLYGNVGVTDGSGRVIAPLSLKNLVLDAAAISGFSNDGKTAQLQADTLTLQNSHGSTVAQAGTGTGDLMLTAKDYYTQGGGSVALNGFSKVSINAGKQMLVSDDSSLKLNSNLDLTAGVLTTLAGRSFAINADDHSVKINGNGDSTAYDSSQFGGSMVVNAGDVTLDNARILMPSGSLQLSASSGDIQVNGVSDIDLAGRQLSFADKVIYTSGGNFSSNADQGKVLFDAKSQLNISSGGADVTGGLLNLSAPTQSVELNGTLKAVGGSALIDVGQYGSQDFDGLMSKLTMAGIADLIYFRSHNADIVQHTGHEIKANSLQLVADKGVIDISGGLNANGAKQGGNIQLDASGKITLRQGAVVSATGGDSGGKVLLSSIDSPLADKGGIDIQKGALVDVGGPTAEKGGEVVLRAQRVGADGINIQPIAGAVKGYGQKETTYDASGNMTALGYNKFFGEAVKTYGNAALGSDGSLDAKDFNAINSDTATYMAAVAAKPDGGISLRPVDFIAYDGDLKISTPMDFASQRFGKDGEIAGTIMISATGNLNVNQSISDGYKDGSLLHDHSWNFQLVAGADKSSADKFATSAERNLVVGHNTSIHSGTGNIKLAAGGNVQLVDQSATVFSAGRQDVVNPYGTLDNVSTTVDPLLNGNGYGSDGVPGTLASLGAGEYPIDGGEVLIRAHGDINGAISNQYLNQWLLRQGDLNADAHGLFGDGLLNAWAIDASNFQQNIGSFGGGKVDIAAGHNISDLSVLMPTTGKQLGTSVDDNHVQVLGGGDMSVRAGGDIAGGVYFLGKGNGVIYAGGAIKGSVNQFQDGPQLLMSGDQADAVAGNSHMNLFANRDVKIAGVSDAMPLESAGGAPVFFSYTDKSFLGLTSLAGDVHLNAASLVEKSLLGIPADHQNPDQKDASLFMQVYPASLDATAVSGSVRLDSDVVLFPAQHGNVNLLASQDITSGADRHYLKMSDTDLARLPSVKQSLTVGVDGSMIQQVAGYFDTTAKDDHAPQPVHSGDTESARVITRQGDISSVFIDLPKQAIIQSGRDLINTPIILQQVNVGDASLIAAGRDLKFDTLVDSNGVLQSDANSKIEIAGPGQVLLKTGRDLDLGSSVGLTTIGNANNPRLPEQGASLDILVGLNSQQPDYVAFVEKYLPGNDLYVSSFKTIKKLLGNEAFSDSDAVSVLKKMSPEQVLAIQPQLNAVLNGVFFNELKLAGTASAKDKALGNEGGFNAIKTLFSDKANWQGDLTLFYSKIQTERGGDINLMVPGGKVNAGLSVAPGGNQAKSADKLGIVVQRQGQINAFVDKDFAVNTSRTFTLGGGDILIWSSEGDIDAGKGAKSALSVKSDAPYYDSNSQLVIPPPLITSGSGIRTASSGDAKEGDVYLFAPKGVVNAGEAGIAGSNVTISATAVLGANNIQVSGIGVGVPAAASGSVAAGLTGTSNLTASVSQMAEASVGGDVGKDAKNSLAKAIMGILSIDLLGFGE